MRITIIISIVLTMLGCVQHANIKPLPHNSLTGATVGEFLGRISSGEYFYQEMQAGMVKVVTNADFFDEEVIIDVKPGKTYFVKHNIDISPFFSNIWLELVHNAKGQKEITSLRRIAH